VGEAAAAVEAASAMVGEAAAAVEAAAVVGAAAAAIALACTAPARGGAGVADRCGRRRPPARRPATTSAGGLLGRRMTAAAKATPAGAVPVAGAVAKASPTGAGEGHTGGRLVDAAGAAKDSSAASSAARITCDAVATPPVKWEPVAPTPSTAVSGAVAPAPSVAAVSPDNTVGNPDATSGPASGGTAKPVGCQYAGAGVPTPAEPAPPKPCTPVYERSYSDMPGSAGNGGKRVPPAREPDKSNDGSNNDGGGGVENSTMGGAGPAVPKGADVS